MYIVFEYNTVIFDSDGIRLAFECYRFHLRSAKPFMTRSDHNVI